MAFVPKRRSAVGPSAPCGIATSYNCLNSVSPLMIGSDVNSGVLPLAHTPSYGMQYSSSLNQKSDASLTRWLDQNPYCCLSRFVKALLTSTNSSGVFAGVILASAYILLL